MEKPANENADWFVPAAEFERPRMNADKHRCKPKTLSVLICVHLWLILFSLSAAPRWKIQFLYDHADANFAIEDLECPTALHCVAAGLIDDKKGHDQGAGGSDQRWRLALDAVRGEGAAGVAFLLERRPGLDGHRSRAVVHGGRRPCLDQGGIAQRDIAGLVPGCQSWLHRGTEGLG